MRGPACLAIIAAGLAVSGPAWADALQAQLLAGMRTTRADAFAFRRTLVMDRTGSPRQVRVEQFDPRRGPGAAAWTLVGIDGRAPTAEEVRQAAKNRGARPPSYLNLAEWFGAPATRTDGPGGAVTYRFARLPAGTFKMGSRDISADSTAEAVVDTHGRTPFVEEVRIASTKSFRMMMVASVSSVVATNGYRQLPDGRVVPASAVTTITGSMMGKSGEIRNAATITEVQPIR